MIDIDPAAILAAAPRSGAIVDRADPELQEQPEATDTPRPEVGWHKYLGRTKADAAAVNDAARQRIDEARLQRIEQQQNQIFRERRMRMYQQAQAQQAERANIPAGIPQVPVPVQARQPARQALPAHHGPGMGARLGKLAAGVTDGSAFRIPKRRRSRS